MSKAYKCDSCGELKEGEPETVHLSNGKDSSGHRTEKKHKKYEVCPNCQKRIDFLILKGNLFKN